MSYYPSQQPPTGGRQFYFDPRSGRRYWVDNNTNEQVFDNGERAPRSLPDAIAQPQPQRWQSQGGTQNYYTLPQTLSPALDQVRRDPSAPSVPPALPYSLSTRPLQSPLINRPGPPNNLSYFAAQPAQDYPLYSAPSGNVLSPAISATSPNTHRGQDMLTSQFRNISINDTSRPPGPLAPVPRQGAPNASTCTREEQGGMQVEYRYDAQTNVQTRIGRRPPPQYADPFLRVNNYPVESVLLATSEEQGTLFSSFRTMPNDYFRFGRVFQVLWAEPAGAISSLVTEMVGVRRRLQPGISVGQYGEFVYSKVRRFVVVREHSNFCTALPISSYGRQGVAKRGVVKSDHAIIYIGSTPPEPGPGEAPQRGEYPMRPNPIRMIPNEPHIRLDRMSRLNLGKPHTVESNLKVSPIGMVHEDSLGELRTQFHNVILRQQPDTQQPHIRDTPSTTRSTASQQAVALRQGQVLRQVQDDIHYFTRQGLTQSEAIAAERQMRGRGYTREQAVDAINLWRVANGQNTRVGKLQDEIEADENNDNDNDNDDDDNDDDDDKDDHNSDNS